MTTRRVSSKETISFAAAQYKAGAWLAEQEVEVVCDGGLVQLHHRGVLIATHARRHALGKQDAGLQRGRRLPPAPKSVTAASVTRKVDSSGNVCFAGTNYRLGSTYRRRQACSTASQNVEARDRQLWRVAQRAVARKSDP